MKIKTIIAVAAVGLGVVGAVLYVKHRRSKTTTSAQVSEVTGVETVEEKEVVAESIETVSVVEEPGVEIEVQVEPIDAAAVTAPAVTAPTRRDWRFLKREFTRHVRAIKTGVWVDQGEYVTNLLEYPNGKVEIVIFKNGVPHLTVMKVNGVLYCSFGGPLTTHHDDLTNALLALNNYGYE